jgi:hypothetical protein
MKTSNDISQIEKYIFGKLRTSSRLLFEAKLLIDPLLNVNVEMQRKLYSIIRVSGRRKIKSEISRVHQTLFTDPSYQTFQKTTFELFSKK